MTITDICDELTAMYFNGSMPAELRACLEDHYSSAVCCEIADEAATFKDAASDVEAYLDGKLTPNVRIPYQRLKDDYDELQDFTAQEIKEHRASVVEVSYMRDFISYMGLEEKYEYFRENTYLEPFNGGLFDHYTL